MATRRALPRTENYDPTMAQGFEAFAAPNGGDYSGYAGGFEGSLPGWDNSFNNPTEGFEPYSAPGIAPGEPAPGSFPGSEPSPPQYGSTVGNQGWLDMGGINAEKLESAHNSPKYQILRTLSNFDPRQGITGDVLGALNSLGIGTFSGQGDKLRVSGGSDEFNGLSEFDTIVDWDNAEGRRWSFSPGGGGGGMNPGTNLFEAFNAQYGQGGGGGGAPAPVGGGGGAGFDLRGLLQQIASSPDGGLNQKVITSRLDSARGQLDRQRKSTQASTDAMLAERGLIGSGPEATALFKNNQDVAESFGNKAQEIYANEAENADARMIQALSMLTGMSIEDAKLAVQSQLGNRGLDIQNALGQGRLNLDSMLGQGNLALGNLRANMDWNQFLAQHGLDRDVFGYQQSNNSFSQMIQLLDLYLRGAGTAAGGYI